VEGARSDNGKTGSNRPVDSTTELTVTQSEEYNSEDLDAANIFEEYRPAISIEGAQKHPADLVESAAMATVKAPPVTYVPHIDKKLVESGALSDVQLEAVALAGAAHQEHLADSKALNGKGARKGFFIGDGTGVGKGREIAGIILDNWNQGKKKALWVSQSVDLINDARRDLKDLGIDSQLLIDYSNVKFGSKIPNKEGILFVSYDTLKVAKGTVNRLNPLVEWAGENFEGVIAFDESHTMGNALSVQGTGKNKTLKESTSRGRIRNETQRRTGCVRIRNRGNRSSKPFLCRTYWIVGRGNVISDPYCIYQPDRAGRDSRYGNDCPGHEGHGRLYCQKPLV
jgi:hypothetical protein